MAVITLAGCQPRVPQHVAELLCCMPGAQVLIRTQWKGRYRSLEDKRLVSNARLDKQEPYIAQLASLLIPALVFALSIPEFIAYAQ